MECHKNKYYDLLYAQINYCPRVERKIYSTWLVCEKRGKRERGKEKVETDRKTDRVKEETAYLKNLCLLVNMKAKEGRSHECDRWGERESQLATLPL